ncbi:winged helix-turn-helix domain-containing protein [Nostoc sp.]|uniref:winged helix-turn-helix domain-containing protein n=1 Tax=Nostoc sp. TaxID=1180 RepID=UPI003FA5B951
MGNGRGYTYRYPRKCRRTRGVGTSTEFAGYKEIQNWLGSVLGIEAEYATVHHLVRYQLKAKLKVPRPRNRKQDTQKLEAFKKTLAMTYN